VANRWNSEIERLERGAGQVFRTGSSHNYKLCSTCHGIIYKKYCVILGDNYRTYGISSAVDQIN
jgi:hypothetical protein